MHVAPFLQGDESHGERGTLDVWLGLLASNMDVTVDRMATIVDPMLRVVPHSWSSDAEQPHIGADTVP